MSEFESERESARNAILTAECTPLMAEDVPSRSTTPRNACLDLVKACDVLLLIVGSRGGYVAQDTGKLVVREEFEEAKRLNKKILFIDYQNGSKDGLAKRLADEASNYTSGLFRTTATSPLDLEQSILESLLSLPIKDIRSMSTPIDFSELKFQLPSPSIVLIAKPVIAEDFADDLDLHDESKQRYLLDVLHTQVRYFSYSNSTIASAHDGVLSISSQVPSR